MTDSQSIRVGLADDQSLIREGLKAVLDGFPDIDVVLEADSGLTLLEGLAETVVDLIVSDIRMPGMDGIALTRRLREQGLTVPVLLLTTFDEESLMLKAVEAGAQGFLLKDVAPDDLQHAIREVVAGRGLLQPVTTARVRDRYTFADQNPPGETFSPREVDILRLLAGGYSNREIARTIYLAEGTVKNYVSDILAKLECRDRTRAVLKAITLRII